MIAVTDAPCVEQGMIKEGEELPINNAGRRLAQVVQAPRIVFKVIVRRPILDVSLYLIIVLAKITAVAVLRKSVEVIKIHVIVCLTKVRYAQSHSTLKIIVSML
jgi:hypothetical protein